MDQNLGELPQVDDIDIAPKIVLAEDDYLANYGANLKKRASNDMIWISLIVTLIGFVAFTFSMSVISLCLLTSTFGQRNKPSGFPVTVGICTAIGNFALIGLCLVPWLKLF